MIKKQGGSAMMEYLVVFFFSAGLFYFGMITIAKPTAQAHSEQFLQKIKLPH